MPDFNPVSIPSSKLMVTYKAKHLREDLDISSRNKFLEDQCIISSTVPPFPNKVTSVFPMPWYEELVVIVFWGTFFGIIMFGPVLIYYLIYIRAYTELITVLSIVIATSIIPIPFHKDSCYYYFFTLLLKYHSNQGIWNYDIPSDGPVIIVGPPHGVFPFGSVIACVSIPRTTGATIRGLAATALIYFPIIGIFLRFIGIIDASRSSAMKYLLRVNKSNSDLNKYNIVGISSGGIAEIFKTNSISRSYLVPSYVFGNNQCFSVWYDRYGILESLSRTLRVSICFFWGRWGLPIPYRVPILGVAGKPIKVEKVENPTNEQIQKLLDELQSEVLNVFELYKSAYGWNDVELEIQ